MEDLELQDKPGIFTRLRDIWSREEGEDEIMESPTKAYQSRPNYKYHISVRRQIVAFEDALTAANGLKRGEQQILNLSSTDPSLRQKIVDFMSGVNFSIDGTWEEIGENIYLVVPPSVYVETVPASPRSSAVRN